MCSSICWSLSSIWFSFGRYHYYKATCIIVKLLAFGFDYKLVRVTHTYVNGRFKITNVAPFFSDRLWYNFFGMLEDLTFNPLLTAVSQ